MGMHIGIIVQSQSDLFEVVCAVLLIATTSIEFINGGKQKNKQEYNNSHEHHYFSQGDGSVMGAMEGTHSWILKQGLTC